MITVVEGPSAVGKTSLLHRLPSSQVITEDWATLGFPQETWPDLHTPEGQVFGVTLNSHRWKLLCAAEDRYSIAYADTDPLKLYYNFALALHGSLSRDQLLVTFRTCRQAMAEEHLGFADAIIFLYASPETLWARKQQDGSRRRGKFGLHVQLVDAFATYYMLLGQVRPGTVTMCDTDQHDISSMLLTQYVASVPHYQRYDIDTFDLLQQRVLDYLDTSSLWNRT